MDKKAEPERPRHVSVPLRMPADLEAKIEAAREQTGLAKQDVMRLSIERGLEILVAQLNSKPAALAEVAA